MMRIVHVMATVAPSGAERMLEVVGPLAVADGFRPAILSTGEAEFGPFAPRMAAAGYDLHHIPFTRDLSFPRRLAAWLRRERFDVVHIHCERASFWIAAAARLAGVRRIVRTHHNVFLFDGGLRWRRTVQRAAQRHLFGVIANAPSPSVVDNERQRFANPVALLPAWIDPAFRPPTPEDRLAARQHLGLDAQTMAVVCVGSCAEVKNHAALIGAIAHLSGQGRNVTLLHAGTGVLEADEQALAGRLGIAPQVRFLGAVEDVRSVLHAADIYAMPSHREGLPIAGLEALACGLPAVLTDTYGLRDLGNLGPLVRWTGLDQASIVEGLAALMAIPEAERRAQAADAAQAVQRRHGAVAAWAQLRGYYTPDRALALPSST